MLALLGATSMGWDSRFHWLILLQGWAGFPDVCLILIELISSAVGALGRPIIMCSELFG